MNFYPLNLGISTALRCEKADLGDLAEIAGDLLESGKFLLVHFLHDNLKPSPLEFYLEFYFADSGEMALIRCFAHPGKKRGKEGKNYESSSFPQRGETKEVEVGK